MQPYRHDDASEGTNVGDPPPAKIDGRRGHVWSASRFKLLPSVAALFGLGVSGAWITMNAGYPSAPKS
jgi:hypothetical protein